jgi:hypothetical protein
MHKDNNNFDNDNSSERTIPKFPIEVFPETFRDLAKEAFDSFGYPYEFMAGGFLFVTSTLVGNSYRIRIKPGWEEPAMLWLVQVGRPATLKTPPLKMTLKPVIKIDIEKYNQYVELKDQYNKLKKEDKVQTEEPVIERHIFNEFTIEALFRRHAENQFGIGIHKNELSSWFGNMNKYKQNSNDQAIWIGIWDGDQVDTDTISRGFEVISLPNIPIIGGIQPVILQGYLSNGTTTFNGFSDRLLYLYSDAPLKPLDDNEIDKKTIKQYEDVIRKFEDKMMKVYRNNKKTPQYLCYSEEAKVRMQQFDHEIIKKQRKDIAVADEQYLSKLRTYFHRIALNLELLNANDELPGSISIKTVENTKKLINYFYESYLFISSKTSIIEELNNIIGTMNAKTKKEKAIALLKKGFGIKEIALILKSKEQVIRNYKSSNKFKP